MEKSVIVLLSIICSVLLSLKLQATQFYVSPTGSSSGNGSISNPWDLKTAFSHPSSVLPGDTIYLRGGTYYGHFICNLSGTLSNPIIVKSFPGEWAVIDGYSTTTLTQSLPTATPYTGGHTLSFANATNLKNGDVVEIGTVNSTSPSGVEMVYLNGKASANSFTNCVRGWGATAPVVHNNGETVNVNASVITVNGSDVILRDFEVKYSFPVRKFYYFVNSNSGIGNRPEGIYLSSPRVKIINLIIHDCMEGVGFWDGAVDSEVYGCIIFNNGIADSLRGHGHGLYIQNSDTVFSKKITDVISFNNFSSGMKAFGYSGSAINIYFDKVIAFNNGAPATFSNNPSAYPTNQREFNLFAGTSSIPLKNISFTNCFLYHQPYTISRNAVVGYGSTDALNINVTNNYIGGGSDAFSVTGVKEINFNNNTVYATKKSITGTGIDGKLVGVSAVSANPIYNWDNNQYYDKTNDYSFGYPNTTNALGGGNIKFSETPTVLGKGWKQWTGFDANSTYVKSKPNNQVFINQNKYDSSRYDVVVYNWDLSPTVQLNISSLGWMPGTQYKLYNVLDYFKDTLVGVYTGSGIAIDMVNRTVQTPIGLSDTYAASTFPEFGTFVLRKLNAVTTSIDAKENGLLKIYPSPFTDELTIEYYFDLPFLNKQLIIKDVLGRVVWSETLIENKNKLTRQLQLPSGLYILNLLSNGIVVSEEKIISIENK